MARHQQRHELVAQVAVARRVAVLVALLEQHASIESSPGSARRRAITSNSSESKCSTPSRKRPHGLRGPRSRCTSAIESIRGIERTVSSVPWTASRSSAVSRSPRTPKTTWRIVSSVSRFMRSIVTTRPSQPLSSARASSATSG